MNTSKGAKGCPVPELPSGAGALSESEDTWTLDPDHMLQKSWPVIFKSSIREFPSWRSG